MEEQIIKNPVTEPTPEKAVAVVQEKSAPETAVAPSQESPTNQNSPTATQAQTKPLDLSQKTTGERYYDVAQFAFGKAWIMTITAVLAYYARYGKKNPFKWVQDYFHEGLLTNKVFPMKEKGEFWNRFAGAAANTMAICWGGNLFAPAMKWMENSKEEISNYFNRRFGKPGEEEIAHERLKDAPKQSWGDVITGRLAAWGVVFGSFVAIDSLVGKHKPSGKYHFDRYDEKFGRLLSYFSKDKEIYKIPLSKELTALQKENKFYRSGKIIGLDVYATTAAIVIWNTISRLSAKKRNDKMNGKHKIDDDHTEIGVSTGFELPLADNVAAQSLIDQGENKRYTASVKPRTTLPTEKSDLSHAGALEAQRQDGATLSPAGTL